jgi:hypothetical protein
MTKESESDGFISCHPPVVQDAPGLTEARGILADIAHHSDDDIARACGSVIALSDDYQERAGAKHILTLVEGKCP